MGHKLHVDVAVVIDESALLAEVNVIATVRIAAPESHGHHHAPDPFQVHGKLAQGLLEIVDTEDGERFRLRVSRHAEGLSAAVDIKREAGLEQHALLPVKGDHHLLQSVEAPAEPHEFDAELVLSNASDSERLAFRMLEPQGHHH